MSWLLILWTKSHLWSTTRLAYEHSSFYWRGLYYLYCQHHQYLLMFVLGKDSEWMDRWPSIWIDGTCTMYASYVCVNVFIQLFIMSIHPFTFSINPYINIARHMSALTIYRIEEMSIKQTSFVVNNRTYIWALSFWWREL